MKTKTYTLRTRKKYAVYARDTAKVGNGFWSYIALPTEVCGAHEKKRRYEVDGIRTHNIYIFLVP